MALANIINSQVLGKYLELWISEDTPIFDLSFYTVSSEKISAQIEIKGKCILAGLPFAEAIFNYFDCRVEWKIAEGSMVDTKTIVAEVCGLSYKLLKAEKTALNLLSRASGVATIARRVVTKVKSKWNGQISALHKISPGLKMVEKYAMYVGGIVAQGYDMSSVVVLNENNIKSNGSIETTMKIIKEKLGSLIIVEAKCIDKQEALDAVAAGVNVVMLDNFKPQDVKTISKQIKDSNPSMLIGVSGGITENNILEYAIDNVDIISSNLFSQGYRSIDLSLNIIPGSPVTFIPDIVETINDPIIPIDVAVLDKGINGTAVEPVVTIIEAETSPKVTITRTLDETSNKTDDSKSNTVTVENPKKEIKKIEEKVQVKVVPGAGSNNDGRSSTKIHKVANNIIAKTSAKSVYNMKSLGSARMPGHPVGAQLASRAQGRNGARATLFRSMAVGLSLTFPGTGGGLRGRSRRDNEMTFVRGGAPMIQLHGAPSRADHHGPLMIRPAASAAVAASQSGSMLIQCRHCSYTNPGNGPPICRMCRQMLF